MFRLNYISVLPLLFALGCKSFNQDDTAVILSDPWSVRLAENVVKNHEKLVYYDRKPGKEKLQYDVALLGMAIDKLGSVDEKYSNYLKEYVDFFVDSSGKVLKYRIEEYSLDRINFAKNIITLYKRTGDAKYSYALQHFVKQIETHPKTNSGGFWHKKIYPWQMWLDGSYMAIPFIAQYAKEFDRPEWFDLATWQLNHMYEVTHDDKTGLLFHGWDESREQKWCDPTTGKSKIFWGRSMGWYSMALVDVLEFLPEDHPKRQELIHILKNTLDTLLKVRDVNTGLWYQVLDEGDKPGNYIETSCSAMFIYSIAKAVNYGYLPESYKSYADKSFESLTDHYLKLDKMNNLILKNTVGGCGLGGFPYRAGTYEYYVSEKKVDNDPKGVGALILAAIELNK